MKHLLELNEAARRSRSARSMAAQSAATAMGVAPGVRNMNPDGTLRKPYQLADEQGYNIPSGIIFDTPIKPITLADYVNLLQVLVDEGWGDIEITRKSVDNDECMFQAIEDHKGVRRFWCHEIETY